LERNELQLDYKTIILMISITAYEAPAYSPPQYSSYEPSYSAPAPYQPQPEYYQPPKQSYQPAYSPAPSYEPSYSPPVYTPPPYYPEYVKQDPVQVSIGSFDF
jgi:hypothetical protein